MNRRIKSYTAFFIISIGSIVSLFGQPFSDTLDIKNSGLPDSLKIEVLNNSALSYQYTSLSRALHYADLSMEIANKLDRPDLYARTYNLYGGLYLESGLYSNAEKYYTMAYDLYKEIESYEGLATECHNLGLTLFLKGDTINSLNYYKESVKVRKLSGNNRRIGDGLTTLGEVYHSIGKDELSITQLYEALNYYGDTLAYPRKMECISFIIDILIKRKPSQALPWLKMLEDNNSILKSKQFTQLIGIRYASYYLARGDFDESIRYLDLFDPDSLITNNLINPVKIYLAISERLAEAGMLEKGLSYSKVARDFHSKQQDLLLTNMTSEFKTRLNLRFADEELRILKEQNRITLQRLKIDEIIKTIIIIAVIILSVLGISFLINLLILAHVNHKLKSRKLEMEAAHNRLVKYREGVLKTRENKNVFFSMISGKLNQPFADLTMELDSLAKLTANRIVKERFKNKLKDILKIGTQIEKSLKRVLLWSKLHRNRYEVQYSEILINDYLHDLLPDILGITVKGDIKVRFDVDQNLIINFDKHSLKTILRILIENSVENSESGSDIIIRGQKARTGSIISVTDFGNGIPGWLQAIIFDFDRHFDKSEKTSNLGLGLLIARKLAELNSSYISFESNQKKGTTFFLHIPKENG